MISIASGSGYAGSVYQSDRPGAVWYANGSPISGASGQTWTMTVALEGATIYDVLDGVSSNTIEMWIPTDLGSSLLHAWFDGADPSARTMVSNLVASLLDKSGRGQHLNQATAAQRPSAANNEIQFPGAMSLKTDANFSISGSVARTAYVVGRRMEAAINAYALFWGAENGAQAFGIDLNNPTSNQIVGFTWANDVNIAANRDGLVVVGLRHDGASTLRGSLNGTVTATRTVSISTPASPLLMNYRPGQSGRVAIREEVIAGNLSSSDEAKLQGYLAWRNGLQGTLPGSHAYAASAPRVDPAATPGTGAGSATLSPVEGSGAGALRIAGAASQSLDPLQASSAGRLAIVGSGAALLSAMEGAGQSQLALTATGANPLDPMTGTAIGTAAIVGVGLASLSELQGAGGASTTDRAAGSVTLSPLAGAATARNGITGAGSATFDPVTGSAYSAAPGQNAGRGEATFSDLTSSSIGSLPIKAQGQATLSPVQGAGASRLTTIGAGVSSFSPVSSTASATATAKGAGDASLSPLQGSGASATVDHAAGSATLSPLTSDSVGRLALAASGAATLNPATSAAIGSTRDQKVGAGEATLASLASSATASILARGAGTATLAPVLSSAGANLPILGAQTFLLGAVQSTAMGRLALAGAGFSTLAPLTAAGRGGMGVVGDGDATLDELTGTGSGVLFLASPSPPSRRYAIPAAPRLYASTAWPRSYKVNP